MPGNSGIKLLTEKDYFEARSEDFAYVSKSFAGVVLTDTQQRFVIKKFSLQEDETVEEVRLMGEYTLSGSISSNIQLKVLLLRDSHEIESIVIQKFKNGSPTPDSVSFKNIEFVKLLEFLNKIRFIDFKEVDKFRIRVSEIDTSKVLVDRVDAALMQYISSLDDADRRFVIESLAHKKLTFEELNILSGRKAGLQEFEMNLFGNSSWKEKEWQDFFSRNEWVFGYGLDYRFLRILQREAHVSDSDLGGDDSVISDYLMGSTQFTVLVELKRPDTVLFEATKMRSKTWELSHDLTKAVSQILIQKATWQISSRMNPYDENGQPIHQDTVNPKTILVIGSTKQFVGVGRNEVTKRATFELYRRNSRDIEIITYDELFERAYYLVNQTLYTR